MILYYNRLKAEFLNSKLVNKILNIVQNSKLQIFLVFILPVVAMLWILSADSFLSGNDSYFHLKMALLLPKKGFLKEFPWIYWSSLRTNYVNHYYGFHALLMPFAYLGKFFVGDSILFVKIFNFISVILTVFLFVLILLRRNIKPAIWLFFLFLAPWHFWLRMGYIRAFVPNLLFLVLAIYLHMRNKKWIQFIVAFCAVHLYSGGLLIIFISISFFLASLIKRQDIKNYFQLLALTFTAIVLALLISPYFPSNLKFIYEDLLAMFAGVPKHSGVEWLPYKIWNFVQMSWLYLSLNLLAFILLFKNRKIKLEGYVFCFLNIIFLFLVLKSRHFIEYWPIFTLLCCAELLKDTFKFGKYFKRQYGIQVIIILFLFLAALPGLKKAGDYSVARFHHKDLKQLSEVLDRNTRPGDLVFMDLWEFFPALFYYSNVPYYMFGLDPIYTKEKYPEIFYRMVVFDEGNFPTKIVIDNTTGEEILVDIEDIRNVFRGDFVFLSGKNIDLLEAVQEREDLFEKIYPSQKTDNNMWHTGYYLFRVIK